MALKKQVKKKYEKRKARNFFLKNAVLNAKSKIFFFADTNNAIQHNYT